jgi:hypothetical protein
MAKILGDHTCKQDAERKACEQFDAPRHTKERQGKWSTDFRVRWQQASQVTTITWMFPSKYSIHWGIKWIAHISSESHIYHYCTTRESDIYPKVVFRFVQGIFAPGTNNYICTRWRRRSVQMLPQLTGASRGLLQPTRSKCLTFVPGSGSDWYKCEDDTFEPGGDTPPKNVVTIIPGHETPWYKCSHPITAPPFSLRLPCNPCIYVDKFIYLSLSIHISFLFSPVPIFLLLSSLSICTMGARGVVPGLAQQRAGAAWLGDACAAWPSGGVGRWEARVRVVVDFSMFLIHWWDWLWFLRVCEIYDLYEGLYVLWLRISCSWSCLRMGEEKKEKEQKIRKKERKRRRGRDAYWRRLPHLYRAEAPPGTNVRHLYRVSCPVQMLHHICTWCFAPVQYPVQMRVMNSYKCPFSSSVCRITTPPPKLYTLLAMQIRKNEVA